MAIVSCEALSHGCYEPLCPSKIARGPAMHVYIYIYIYILHILHVAHVPLLPHSSKIVPHPTIAPPAARDPVICSSTVCHTMR